jgi:hypothetical protein
MRIELRSSWSRLVALGLTASALAGCGTRVDYTPTNTPPSATAARHAQDVDVYASGGPSVPYVEIGFLDAQQESSVSVDDRSDVFEELRERAGELGCDAIVILGAQDTTAYVSTEHYERPYTLNSYRASCVVYVPAEISS